MKLREDFKNIQLWFSTIVTLIWTVVCILASVFLTSVLLPLAFGDALDHVAYQGGGKAQVQQILEGVSFLLLFVSLAVCAFLRGKRRTKRVKPSKEMFFRGVCIATAVLILPALLLMNLTDPSDNKTLLFLYLPYVCLTEGLGFTQLSLLATAFLTAGVQYYTYWLGTVLRRRRDDV